MSKTIQFDTANVTTVNNWNITGTPVSGYIYLPGISGSYISTPNATWNQITGDIDLRFYGNLASWAPTPGDNDLITKWFSSSNNRSYAFSVKGASGGKLVFYWSTAGSVTNSLTSSVATGFSAGTDQWVRVTFATSTGTATFYTSSDGSTWTQLGTPQVFGASSIFSGSADVLIGSESGGNTSLLTARVYKAQVLNGIGGTIVSSVDFTTTTTGLETTYTDSGTSGATWTVNGAVNNNIYLQSTTSGTQAKVQQPVNDTEGNSFTITGAGCRITERPFVALPGVAGTYVNTPNAAWAQITGDIDIRVRAAIDNWKAGVFVFLTKWSAVSNQRGYQFYIDSNAKLNFGYSHDGTTSASAVSSVGLSLAPGAAKWVRSTFASASGQTIFYFSDDGINWTQLGTTQTIASGTIFNCTADVEIGAQQGGVNNLITGKFYNVQIYNGINGTLAGSFDATLANGGSSPSWTFNGTAVIEVP